LLLTFDTGLDEPTDGFRIRLICTLLDTCGKFFEKGEKRIKLDRFLVFFQRYIFTKNFISLDLEFMILDTFQNLRPKLRTFENLEEVDLECKRIEELEKKMELKKNSMDEDYVEEKEEEKLLDLEGVGEEEQYEEHFGNYGLESEEDVYKREKPKHVHISSDMQNAFDMDLKRMIDDEMKTIRSKVPGKKQGMKISLPMPISKKTETEETNPTLSHEGMGESEENLSSSPKKANQNENMKIFNLITKKGTNKTITKKIAIPKNSQIVISNKIRMQEEEVRLF
jgi:regulator of nonsense transcripts 2